MDMNYRYITPIIPDTIRFIKSLYPNNESIPLHAPLFSGNEKKYVIDAIDSTFISSIGEYVKRFEEMICKVTGTRFAVATINGTSALHIALKLAGVEPGDEVITQPLSFVATANAIAYCGARPIFLDVNIKTASLDSTALERFLRSHTHKEKDACYNIDTGQRIAACVPMHTFGHPCQIEEIAEICRFHNISLIEDAAEAIGSTYKRKHVGTFGLFGVFSFNGNKTVTCGGGGAIVTNDEKLWERAKHITTTAKIRHEFEYIHDAIGYNYRLPNLNAALACAQLEQLDFFLQKKRDLAEAYKKFFERSEIIFFKEPNHAKSNYWLNTIILQDRKMRNNFLRITNEAKIQTRPVWKSLNKLEMFKNCQSDLLKNAGWLEDRMVNIPSSVRV